MCCKNDAFCAKRRKIGVFSYFNEYKLHEKCISIRKQNTICVTMIRQIYRIQSKFSALKLRCAIEYLHRVRKNKNFLALFAHV